MRLTKKQARRIIIHSAGLHRGRVFGSGKKAVLNTIDHLGYVQIDTISIVERAHHHVLAARIPRYRAGWLDQLQREAKILEYWAHAAAYLPMTDYRYTLPLKKYFAEGKDRWPKSEKALMKKVLHRIELEGPLMARDFEAQRKSSGQGWWDWKPAKLALERLFFEGSLVTVGRQGFQKVYDLPERYLPKEINVSMPTEIEYAQYLIERAIQSHGIVSLPEITYLRKTGTKAVKNILQEKISHNQLIQVSIAGNEGVAYFTDPLMLDNTIRIRSHLKILSPFDNLTIQRNRLKNIFDFDYQIECYLPAPKRQFGYFCLPLLYGDEFVGRIDAKADRKEGILIVKEIYFEGPNYAKIAPEKYLKAFRDFAEFNGCKKFIVQKSNRPDFIKTFTNRKS